MEKSTARQEAYRSDLPLCLLGELDSIGEQGRDELDIGESGHIRTKS